MKLVIGVIASVCLAVVLFGAWLVKDIKDNQLQIGAGEAIAAEPEKVHEFFPHLEEFDFVSVKGEIRLDDIL